MAKKAAEEILQLVGGKENIDFIRHCMTRLRFDLKDNSKVNREKIEALDEVMGTRFDGQQFQVIIGTDVPSFYEEIVKLTGTSKTSNNKQSNKIGNKNVITRIVNLLSDVFVPILPAIIAAGMLKGLLSVLEILQWVSTESDTYQIFLAISDGSFYFLPILVAVSASNKFGLNPFVGVAIAAAVLHPDLTSILSDAGEQNTVLSFMGLPITPASYASQIIPVFFIIWIASHIEHVVRKITPKSLTIILVPTIVLLISVPLFLVAIGPLGTILGDGIAIGISFLFENGGALAGLIFGMLMPFLVITGTQHALVPILLNEIASGRGDHMLPIFATNNISQGAAAIAVFFLVKDKVLKSTAMSTGITGILGVIEPAVYGVNLRFKKPFIAAIIGNGLAGGFMMWFDVKAYIYVKSGLQGIPMLIGETFIYGLIGFAIALFATFALTYFMGIDTTLEDNKTKKGSKNLKKNSNTFDSKIAEIFSPISGSIKDMKEISDPTFSSEMIGKGAAILPSEGVVYSPIDGEVISILSSRHAIGLISNKGIEILIHIGIDTVNLEGKYFTSYVENGDKIHKGDRLIEFDMEAIQKEGYDVITPVIITNTSDYKKIEVNKQKSISNKEILLQIEI
ncbi:beta-glucoside-specific PTS transporter subunit IIABC [Oceanobacillus neutriphilus]|uniref:PTS beta-glucoside transporter subunit IIA n=1 Tax=Oceanobacillus neutriphilus TaxID=531815 RepID=A0ABQ2NQ46_9BACI|nr:beta-glucoside-specific PTS transporter subunit IIABC [Oceanobacillus neutriphilus]GGP07836.1 PTS beta-glucoside transporter subunit IIA [Oceanobacillus neutriphilus]